MHLAQPQQREPFVFTLLSVVFEDSNDIESQAPSVGNRTLFLLMILAGAGALLFGMVWGPIPG
jgi:hypothetical protein